MDICPRASNCKLFQGEIVASQKAQLVYIQLYCKAGEPGRLLCKRYQISQRLDLPPDNLLPNDPRSIDEILSEPHLPAL